MKKSNLGPGVGLLALLVVARSAGATVIVQDSFSYPQAQTVNGQAGGADWSGAWITGQNAVFEGAAAISGAPAVGQAGGAMSVTASGRIFRKLDLGSGSAAAQAGLVQTHSAMFFNQIAGIDAPGTTV